MKRIKNIINQKFGKLTVIKKIGIDKFKNSLWLCKCDCGNEKIGSAKALKYGDLKSCGCLRKDKFKNKYPNIYKRYWNMLKRCYNKNNASYKNYSKQNIKVCEEWKNNYENFSSYILKIYPNAEELFNLGYELDRKDTYGNYEPNNIRIITRKDNSNNRTNNVIINIFNISQTIQQAIDKYSVINGKIIRGRIKRGWDLYSALLLPSLKNTKWRRKIFKDFYND